MRSFRGARTSKLKLQLDKALRGTRARNPLRVSRARVHAFIIQCDNMHTRRRAFSAFSCLCACSANAASAKVMYAQIALTRVHTLVRTRRSVYEQMRTMSSVRPEMRGLCLENFRAASSSGRALNFLPIRFDAEDTACSAARIRKAK